MTDRADNRATNVATLKVLVTESLDCFFLVKLANNILICEKHLLSGVNLRISFRRSPNGFTVISESNKHYKVTIVEANLCVVKWL